jgi:hypothetical protein
MPQMNMVTNRFDIFILEIPKMATPELYLKVGAALAEKAWAKVKSELSGLSSITGLKLGSIDGEKLAISGRDSSGGGGSAGHPGPGRLRFNVALFNFSVEVWIYYPGGAPGAESFAKVAVPKEVEAYREFLTRLNGWSFGSKKLVTDADLKKFTAEFPPKSEKPKEPEKPPKPKVYKNYGEMAKNKADVAAFRAWSKQKGNAKAAKAFSDLDKSAKLKADDPARGTALKAIDAALKDYYASF